MSSTDSLGRAHELLERLQAQLADLERLAEAGETESAIDALADAADRKSTRLNSSHSS